MRIFIRCDETPGEWNLIELQGELSSLDGTLDGKTIGKLSEKDGVSHIQIIVFIITYLTPFFLQRPILIIANHYLEGQRVQLKKPLVIMRKCDEMEMEGTTAENKTQYQVGGVVRVKYLFRNRPRPISTVWN